MNNSKCTIIVYHYIRDLPNTQYPEIKGLLTSQFINQLNYIQDHYDIIELESYIDFLYGEAEIPQNSCILTFDDGFKDHYQNVFPILVNRGLPGCFFPITQPLVEQRVMPVHKTHFILAKVGVKIFSHKFNHLLKKKYPELTKEYYVDGKKFQDSRYRWDDPLTINLKCSIAALPNSPKEDLLGCIFEEFFEDEAQFSQELYMSFKEMSQMVSNGMCFGGHGHSHDSLTNVSKLYRTREISYSKRLLEENTGAKIKSIAYPYGNCDTALVKILKSEGYVCGMTSFSGVNTGRVSNPFRLKRQDTNYIPGGKYNDTTKDSN